MRIFINTNPAVMSQSNDKLIEEILWKAYSEGLGSDVRDRAKVHMEAGMRRSFAYQQAYEDVQVNYR